jgi:hypothetical protein
MSGAPQRRTSKRLKPFQYISSKLIVECHPGDRQEPLHLIRWWKRIFELLDLPLYDPNNHIDRTHFRFLCNMFNASLKRMPDDLKGKFTQFPHPNHPSLASLFARCDELYEIDPTRAPTIIFIQEGDHEAGGTMVIQYAMKVIGAGRDKTTIHGGELRIQGTKEEGKKVVVQGVTMKGSSGHALFGINGLSFLCNSMTFSQCGVHGVYAYNTKGRLSNCVIAQCGNSGIWCEGNALIELEGDRTKVDGNGTSGNGYNCGLFTFDTSSKIHLLFPLTKESVSTNNHGGGNYGSYLGGTIQTVDSFA